MQRGQREYPLESNIRSGPFPDVSLRRDASSVYLRGVLPDEIDFAGHGGAVGILELDLGVAQHLDVEVLADVVAIDDMRSGSAGKAGGDGARRNVGTPVFGGMIFASFIGIFAIPPLYVTFQALRERLRPSTRPRVEGMPQRQDATTSQS